MLFTRFNIVNLQALRTISKHPYYQQEKAHISVSFNMSRLYQCTTGMRAIFQVRQTLSENTLNITIV